MTRIAETLGVSRSNLYERIAGQGKSRGPYFKAAPSVIDATEDMLNVERCPLWPYFRLL